MAKQKTNKPAKPTYEIGDFSGTGYGLISVRALDRANPERSNPRPPSASVYAAQLAYVDVRNAILDDARRRNIKFGLDTLAVEDLSALAERLGCNNAELLGKIPGTVYDRPAIQPLRKPETDNSRPDNAVPLVTAKSDRTRRDVLLLDANNRGVRLGLNEAMTDDLDELERIVKTRSDSAGS